MSHTHMTAPTQFLEAKGIRFAYRRFGKETGVPLVFMQHFRDGLDHWDPATTDGLGRDRPAVLFDHAGVAGSSGDTPDTIQGMGEYAIAFVRALDLHRSTTFNGRSTKPSGSFRDGAANLNRVTSGSRISKATRLIMLASFYLMTMTRMEVAVADPIVTQQVFQVEHVKIGSTKKFAEVEAALDAAIPQLDPAIGAALTNGEEERAKELERGAELFIFLKRDHGTLLQITGRPRKALQYEIGNPFTATRMTRHQIPAALYAPLRVVLYENAAGGGTFEYDKPSTLFGQFGDERVTAVARELDAELERALRRAAE